MVSYPVDEFAKFIGDIEEDRQLKGGRDERKKLRWNDHILMVFAFN